MKFKFKAIKLQNYLFTPFPTPKTNQHAVITQLWIKIPKMVVSRQKKNSERLAFFRKYWHFRRYWHHCYFTQCKVHSAWPNCRAPPGISVLLFFSLQKEKFIQHSFSVCKCVRFAAGCSQHKYFFASLLIHSRSKHLFFFLLKQI